MRQAGYTYLAALLPFLFLPRLRGCGASSGTGDGPRRVASTVAGAGEPRSRVTARARGGLASRSSSSGFSGGGVTDTLQCSTSILAREMRNTGHYMITQMLLRGRDAHNGIRLRFLARAARFAVLLLVARRPLFSTFAVATLSVATFARAPPLGRRLVLLTKINVTCERRKASRISKLQSACMRCKPYPCGA